MGIRRLGKNVGVAEHELKTRLVYMGRKKAAGFVGWATYEMKVRDEWNTPALEETEQGGFGITKLVQKSGA